MRLLVVSNRLPVTLERRDGQIEFHESVGGLVTGVSAYLESMRGVPFTRSEYIWVGWPGMAIEAEERDEIRQRLLEEFQACPVFIPEEIMDEFYLGFCNKTIWPLFHYFPSLADYEESFWQRYRTVNQLFCEAVKDILRPDDVIWIHDYHLMLLPALLRQEAPEVSIGYFHHIPFPSFEIFRLLPEAWRRGILEGLLGADLIGFHTHDYTQYFVRCVLRILGIEHSMGSLTLENRIAQADTFPMGIDYPRFAAAAGRIETRAECEKLRETLPGQKVILSVDRLDYSKGILHRLRAYEVFLRKHPERHGLVTLLLVVVPSRIGVTDYQRMKRQIDEYVGRINGSFGSISWTPVLYRYRYESFQPLVALYGISDIALVTPLRDGMNLVAKEYIASRPDQTGVLILSEMAGAAQELGEALIINPNDIEVVADAILQALEMPEEEQIRRNRIMQTRLERYDVVRWAGDFLGRLTALVHTQASSRARLLTNSARARFLEEYRRAERRLLFLDYDGTLVPFAGRPDDARPDEELLYILAGLADDPRNEIVLISGRERGSLGRWFGALNLTLIAEHGAWTRERGGEWRLLEMASNDWKPHLYPLLERFADRLPGAFIEEKEYSLVWHYRVADPEQAAARALELLDDLVHFTANINIQALQGNKVIEVRSAGINKGTAGQRVLSRGGYDFIMAAGDDWTDEDLFRLLPETAYAIKVGMGRTVAGFSLNNFKQVRELMREMLS